MPLHCFSNSVECSSDSGLIKNKIVPVMEYVVSTQFTIVSFILKVVKYMKEHGM
jgi:hypothetical protein